MYLGMVCSRRSRYSYYISWRGIRLYSTGCSVLDWGQHPSALDRDRSTSTRRSVNLTSILRDAWLTDPFRRMVDKMASQANIGCCVRGRRISVVSSLWCEVRVGGEGPGLLTKNGNRQKGQRTFDATSIGVRGGSSAGVIRTMAGQV